MAYVCIEDYEKHALERLPASVRDYYKSGAGEEYSVKWNREAFKNYRIRPRFLRDVSKRDISTTVLGHKVSMPLGVAPTAMQRMAHPDGECANAREQFRHPYYQEHFGHMVLSLNAFFNPIGIHSEKFHNTCPDPDLIISYDILNYCAGHDLSVSFSNTVHSEALDICKR